MTNRDIKQRHPDDYIEGMTCPDCTSGMVSTPGLAYWECECSFWDHMSHPSDRYWIQVDKTTLTISELEQFIQSRKLS